MLQLFEEWLLSREDHSSIQLEHAITVRFRNYLFKQVFLEEKSTIDDYFETLSSNNRLKGVDIYQLLGVILSSYTLYEYNSDSMSFFEKINSFESFTKMVEAFVENERRIITKDKKNPDDYKYIRRYEFDSLFEFWESINPELALLHEPRKNMNNFGIQTIIVNSVNAETQVEKNHSDAPYLTLINSTIHQINRLIESENTPEILNSLNRVFDVLRREKIVAVAATKQSEAIKEEESFIMPSNPTFQGDPRISPKSRSPLKSNFLMNGRASSPHKNQGEIELKKIYNFLSRENDPKCVTINELQIFFYQLQLTKAHENYLVSNLIESQLVSDPDDITYPEFRTIIHEMGKETDKLRVGNLKEYIEVYMTEDLGGKKMHRTTKREGKPVMGSRSERSVKYGLLERQPGRAESKSTFQLDSEDY